MKTTTLAIMLLFATATLCAQQPTVLLEEAGVENAYPRLSKNGKTVLYQSNRTGKWQLYMLDIAAGTSRRITHDEANNNFPDWDPGNEWIAFVSDRDGNEEIYMVKTDGSGLKRVTNDEARDIHPYFSPDGKWLLFNSTRGNGSLDIYRTDLATGKTEHLTETPQDETCARYFPDMKSIVFLRNDAVSDDVWLMNLTTGLSENLTRTPDVRDGWAMAGGEGSWVYYSSMETGVFQIYRIRKDGTQKQQLTTALPGEEDARAFIGADGNTLIYNKRKSGLIAILSYTLP
jgi:TolB protein